MSEAWYAAFGLLVLLSCANAVCVAALMRQVGVLHQRVPPTGPGATGPEPGLIFDRLRLAPVPGAGVDALGESPVTVMGYVTPSCGLCEPMPGFFSAYQATASPEVERTVSFRLATDVPETEALTFLERVDVRVPFGRHANLRSHYQLTGGAPYVLALRDIGPNRQLLLAGGVVNTLEQLEDLVDITLDRYLRVASPDNGIPVHVGDAPMGGNLDENH